MKIKQNKFQEIHLRLPNELYNEIEKIRGKLSKNEICIEILYKGLMVRDMQYINKIIKSIDNKISYSKLLLEQIYADLDFERKDINKSKNLIEFKELFIKKNKY